MTKISEILSTGQTAKGTPLLSIEELEAGLRYIRERDMIVHSMEAYALKDGRETLTLEFSILGLDGKNDWEAHNDTEKSFSLVKKKVLEARNSGSSIAFRVWLDDASTS